MAQDAFGLIGLALDNKYRVDAVVGEGGFGIVYRGFHLSFEHPIALKCLKVPSHFTPDAQKLFLEKFREEGKMLSRLSDHPSIVRVFDFGVGQGRTGAWVPYLVLEWLRGKDLEQLLRERPAPYSESEALKLLRPCIEAIAMAHGMGIAHRDLKPSNLFLTETARGPVLKVLDFGIAKAMQEGETATQLATRTSSGFSAFSPQYGSPEQFRPKKFGPTGPWTDVHALALVLIEMVTQRPALAGDEFGEWYEAATLGAPPVAGKSGARVSSAFDALCARALARMPSERFQDARELLAAVDAMMGSGAQHAPAPQGGTVAAVTEVLSGVAPSAPGMPPAAVLPVLAVAEAGRTVAATPQYASLQSDVSIPTLGLAVAQGPFVARGLPAPAVPYAAPGLPAAPAQAPAVVPPPPATEPNKHWSTPIVLSVMLGLAMIFAAVIYVIVSGGDHRGGSAQSKVHPVKTEFYVMSQCPYGVQAINGVKGAIDQLGTAVDFQIDYIGSTTPDGALSSMHGPNEVTGDMVQLCAAKVAPAKYLNMIFCQNKNYREVATNWEGCAMESGAPVEKIRDCMNGSEGKSLLSASFQRSQQRGATGSPTIYIGGKQYSGQRKTNDFLRAICAEYDQNKPSVCNTIPESPRVNVTILTDKRCAECQPERYQGMLKSRIGNPVIKTVDYSDPEGRQLYAVTRPGNLPVLVFDKTLEADKDAFDSFNRGLKVTGEYKVAPLGGEWSPVCMSEGGCDKDECRYTLACRKEIPNRLEVFVMSQCPFGVKGLNAMQEVFTDLGRGIDFSIHYIGNGDASSGLTSMHGQAEVDEDIREVCARKYYGTYFKFMDYIWCRNEDIKGTNWEACARQGIDAAVIRRCAEGWQGKQLLEAEFRVSNSMGIGASPTWVANNKYKFSGIDKKAIKDNFCAHNANARGCP